MNFKQRWKRFWTLERRSNSGFTLVELVVVIAILAILAGVAVPVYQEYIKKAEEATDTQILEAANKAFAAACLENEVDAMDATAASVSVIDGQVYGLSSCTFEIEEESVDYVDEVAPYFLTYYEGNEDMTFKTAGINSLVWNADTDCFEMNEGFVSARVVLSNGKTVTVSAEDMEKIQNSTYADMGYSGVKEVIDNVGKSGETLAKICGAGTIPWFGGGYKGLLPKLTNAMKAYGLIDENKANEMLGNLLLSNTGNESYKVSTQEAANGLSMITAKYLASGGDVSELINVDLGNNSTGVIEPMATGTGGTKTVSAIAVQYALASGFANSDVSDGVTIDGKSVADYLASADDPVAAIAKVKNLDAYKNNYVGSEQYNSDVNGFVGTMSILGDNIGTITNPGNISIDGYLANGLDSDDAKDVLTSVLGE